MGRIRVCTEYVASIKRKIHEITGIEPDHQVQGVRMVCVCARVRVDEIVRLKCANVLLMRLGAPVSQ